MPKPYMSVRKAAVAFQFYPGNAVELKEMLKGFYSKTKREQISRAVIAPHAGYIYSGMLAALSCSKLVEAKTFVLLSPNHTGLGARISVSPSDFWETPLGEVRADKALSEKIVENSSAEFDDLAHLGEHSIEVQLPFLQYQFKEFEIVAITIASNELEELIGLGNAIAELKANIAVIASSDFSHFIPLKAAKERDREALALIEALKVDEFHELVQEKNLSICGNAAIIALMQYCKKTGLKKGKTLKYSTSAEQTGDKSSVVGYASVVFA